MECTGLRLGVGGGFEVGCGKCTACRLNRRRILVARMLLEQSQHDQACFVTLTKKETDGCLDKGEAQRFLKRLRHHCGQLRYVLSGEYGDQFGRPHYHAALFGVGADDPGISRAWKEGFVLALPLTVESMCYIAGYVLKKMRKEDQDEGKPPEFRLYSLRPGIGATALPELKRISQALGDDVVRQLRIAGSTFSLGPYIRRKLLEDHPRAADITRRRHREVKVDLVNRDRVPELRSAFLDRIENSKRKEMTIEQKTKLSKRL